MSSFAAWNQGAAKVRLLPSPRDEEVREMRASSILIISKSGSQALEKDTSESRASQRCIKLLKRLMYIYKD